MPLTYIGRGSGFSSETSTSIETTPFLDILLDYQLQNKQSPIIQSLIQKDFEEFNNSMTKPDDSYLQLAIRSTLYRLELPTDNQPKLLHLCDVFKQDLDIWTESPGLPWTLSRIKTKGEIRDDPKRVNIVRNFWHGVKLDESNDFPDSCAYVRSHICKHKATKCSVVWDYPATVTFGEAVFALPLIRSYTELPCESRTIAYGYETSNGGATQIRKRFSRPYPCCYISLNFRKFDKTVPTWMINIAFDILSCNINPCYYEGYGVPHVQRMYRMLERIQDYFINTPIHMSNGKRFQKSSGIASCSYFAQIIRSICNCIILYYTSLKLFRRLPNDAIFLGEDSFLMSASTWNVHAVAEIIRDTFGMDIDVEKSQISSSIDEMTFHGYKINQDLNS